MSTDLTTLREVVSLPSEVNQDNFTPSQRAWIFNYAQTRNMQAAREAADVTQATVRVWRSINPDFKLAESHLNSLVVEDAVLAAQREAMNNIETLKRIRDEGSDREALKAAKALNDIIGDSLKNRRHQGPAGPLQGAEIKQLIFSFQQGGYEGEIRSEHKFEDDDRLEDRLDEIKSRQQVIEGHWRDLEKHASTDENVDL